MSDAPLDPPGNAPKDQNEPQNEPMFNAPWLAVVLPALLMAGYGLQIVMGPRLEEAVLNGYALSAPGLRSGQYDTLITYQFLHGSWTHVLLNAGFCLAFATPVVRAFGRRAGGTLSFAAFFLLCGSLAGLGHCLIAWADYVPIIGASGAISGLMGAAIRLTGDGRLHGMFSRRVLTMTVLYCGINLASAFVTLVPGAGNVMIAWQAHIFGYLAGLLLISPWLRVFHRGYFTRN